MGKTRLAAQLAAQIAGEFGRAWFVDLAPITDPDLVPVTVAGALGLHDQPGRSTTDTVLRFLGGRPALVVLDNCEHLLDATAAPPIIRTASTKPKPRSTTYVPPLCGTGKIPTPRAPWRWRPPCCGYG